MEEEPKPQVLYRYEKYCKSNSFGPGFEIAEIYLKTFKIIKETPAGYWIKFDEWNGVHGRKKWVPKSAAVPYSHTTKEKALKHYQHKVQKHIKILRTQLSYATSAARQIEVMLKEENYLEPDKFMSTI